MKMIELTINGKKTAVERGTTILAAAAGLNIKIPTLCNHELLEPYGACRLCLVEIIDGDRSQVTTSCNYPVTRPLVVETESEAAVKARRMVLEMLLGRCNTSEKLNRLAAEHGLAESRFELDYDDCILCGLCERVCREVVGANAITFANRGVDRVVMPPFDEADNCIGCGACVYVCPTGAIQIQEDGDQKIIDRWSRVLELKHCKSCGVEIAPVFQCDYLARQAGLPEDFFDLCRDCRVAGRK
jgi:NADH dehydrogenase/NADH:ubiquinone oxidoreductase subunit G